MKRSLFTLVWALSLFAVPLLLMASSSDKPVDLSKKWNLPDSPSGTHCAAFVEAINRKDQKYTREFFVDHVAPSFRKAMSMDQHLSQFKWMHENIGEVELLGVRKASPTSAILTFRSKKSGKRFKTDLKFDPYEHHRIASIDVQEAGGYGLTSDSSAQCAQPSQAKGAACCAPKKN